MFRLYYLLTTIMICLLLGLSTSADAESPESKQNFRNAATWYKVARATENGYQAHERAHAARR